MTAGMCVACVCMCVCAYRKTPDQFNSALAIVFSTAASSAPFQVNPPLGSGRACAKSTVRMKARSTLKALREVMGKEGEEGMMVRADEREHGGTWQENKALREFLVATAADVVYDSIPSFHTIHNPSKAIDCCPKMRNLGAN